MKQWNILFVSLTIVLAVLGISGVLSHRIVLPVMNLIMAMMMLMNAKNSYDKRNKKDAWIFIGAAIFVFIVVILILIQ